MHVDPEHHLINEQHINKMRHNESVISVLRHAWSTIALLEDTHFKIKLHTTYLKHVSRKIVLLLFKVIKKHIHTLDF